MRLHLARPASVTLTAALAASLAVATPSAALDAPVGAVGTYDNGGEGNAEIVAHDPSSQRLFVVDAADEQLTILDATDLSLVGEIDVSANGSPNSVAVRPGTSSGATDALVAVAVADGTNPGAVVFHDADGTVVSTVAVGAGPDAVTFTPDGSRLIVANEGEPDGGTDPEGTVSIIDTSVAAPSAVNTLDFQAYNAGAPQDLTGVDGFHPDPSAASIAQDIEPEFVTATDTTAYVSLQEFNGLAKIDLTTETITDVFPLGYVGSGDAGDIATFSLDASDADGGINIADYDAIVGMRQPDAIAVLDIGGTEYVVTANEGDARDANESTVAAQAPGAPYATDEAAGPLKVSDSQSDATTQYAFGSRSFSIFDADGNLVFDSGDDFEQYVAANLPAGAFNSDDPIGIDDSDPSAPVVDPDTDNRSDDKGPEPEGLAVGEVDGTPYAFIGLERQGGIMVYDLSDPSAPVFDQYINGRNLTDYERGVLDWDGDGALSEGDLLDYETNGGDVSPEGITFVSADDSPTGTELLAVAHEISGTVTVYDLGLELAAPPAPAAVDGVRDLDAQVVRTAGEDREATAVEVSKVSYPDGADTVFVATAYNYADALTGGPLAAALDAPILLTKRESLNADTVAEIERLDPDTIFVLGGPVAIAESTYQGIVPLAANVSRIDGENRFETAALLNTRLVDEVGDTGRVFVVEGTNPDPFRGWPDAVSVSAYAAFAGTPIVPIAADDIPTDSQGFLDDVDPEEYVVIGGPVAVNDDTVEDLSDDDGDTVRRLSGETRFDTSAAVYDEAVTQGLGTDVRWLATGRKFPDALTGGAAAGRLGQSLLLVEGDRGVTTIPATVSRLNAAYDTLETVRLLGGPIAIPVADETAIRDIVTFTEPATADFCLTVLHNNDGESQLVDAGRGLADFGGAARFATTLLRERDRANDDRSDCTDQGVLTVTSGDNFLAGPELTASRANGVPFYDSQLLDYLNYDAIDLGNHDFDFGLGLANDFIRGFSPEDDATFLSANTDVAVSGPLAVQVNADEIAPSTIVEFGTHKVGVIGLTTPTLRSISTPENTRIGGLDADGNEDLDAIAGFVADQVAGFGPDVDKVVLISHLQGIDSDQALIPLLSGVDVVVAGGGDEILATPGELLVPGDEQELFGTYPLPTTDADGAAVPVVTTAGSYKYVGRLGVRFDADGDLVDVDRDSRMVRVADESVFDGVAGDAWVQANVVDPVVAFTADLADDVIATSDVPLDGVRQRVRTQETNVGSLLADSLAAAAEARAAEFGLANGDPFVGLANGGGIRNDSLIPAGDVTTLDTFDIAPFSNLVAVFTDVTVAELDTILEHAYSQIENVDGRFAQLGGLRVEVDPSAAAGERVSNITLQDGSPIAGSVNLALPDFTARGGDDYPVDGLGEFTVVGLSYQEALAEFLADLGTVTAADYPDLSQSTADATRIIYPTR